MHVKSNQDPCETWDFQTWLKYGAVMRRLTPEEAIALLPTRRGSTHSWA